MQRGSLSPRYTTNWDELLAVGDTPGTGKALTMCGRFTQHYTWQEVHAFLSVFGPARNLQPHYNIAPTDSSRRDPAR